MGVFLFPGEDLPLRIFEPRYLQLIDEAKQDGFTFGIPFLKDDEIMEYGCEVKLQQVVAESEQGRKVITVESVSLIRIKSFTSQMTGKLYAGGSVEVLPTPPPIASRKLVDLLVNFSERYDKDFLQISDHTMLNSFDVIRSLKLSSEDKYKFLLMNSVNHGEEFLIRQIEYLMLIRNQEKMLNDDFHLN